MRWWRWRRKTRKWKGGQIENEADKEREGKGAEKERGEREKRVGEDLVGRLWTKY